MFKTSWLYASILMLILLLSCLCKPEKGNRNPTAKPAFPEDKSVNIKPDLPPVNYQDGVYEGESCSIYTAEQFFGITSVYIENNKITRVDFKILDKMRNEEFDDDYEQYYAGNDYYIGQCRNDRKGVLLYPEKFLAAQDIDKVDVISLATWSYNLFKDSLKIALGKAR